MQLTVLLKLLVRTAALLALGLAARPLAFHPARGSTLTKVFANDWSMHVDDLSIAINGDVWWTGYTLDTELSQHIAITDTYLDVREGRAFAFDREFNKITQGLENSLGGGAREPSWENVSGTSELEGTVVQFRWEDGASTKRFAPVDQNRDNALLAGLTEDMDLCVLLPKEPAAVGDQWQIDLASLPDLLSPGGYFPWTIESGGTVRLLSDTLDPALMGELRHVLGAMLQGHATVEYLGEEDGHSQLGVTIDVEGTKDVDDLAELAAKIVEELPDWGTIEIERFDLDFSLQASGTARWDTRAGHILDFALQGKLESDVDLELIWDAGSEFLIGLRMAVSGEFVSSTES